MGHCGLNFETVAIHIEHGGMMTGLVVACRLPRPQTSPLRVEGPDLRVARLHQDADEINYVVSGEGTLVLDEEEYTVRQGMSVLIPANVHHQSFNNGDENLIYYSIFAPPPSGPTKQMAQGWVKSG